MKQEPLKSKASGSSNTSTSAIGSRSSSNCPTVQEGRELTRSPTTDRSATTSTPPASPPHPPWSSHEAGSRPVPRPRRHRPPRKTSSPVRQQPRGRRRVPQRSPTCAAGRSAAAASSASPTKVASRSASPTAARSSKPPTKPTGRPATCSTTCASAPTTRTPTTQRRPTAGAASPSPACCCGPWPACHAISVLHAAIRESAGWRPAHAAPAAVALPSEATRRRGPRRPAVPPPGRRRLC